MHKPSAINVKKEKKSTKKKSHILGNSKYSKKGKSNIFGTKKTHREKEIKKVIEMPSDYHNNVEQGIIEFGKKYKIFKKIYSGNTHPLHINHPTQKKIPVLYHPDVYFITKWGGLIIFEILDSEMKDENLIISDILLSCLSPNAKKIFFITPTINDSEKVQDLALTIISNLESKGTSRKELPKVIANLFILKEEANNSNNITKMLIENNTATVSD